MIDKFIKFVKSCFPNNEEGKRNRKKVFIIGIIILVLRVLGISIYGISKLFHYVGERPLLKKIVISIVFIAIIFTGYKIVLSYSIINT